MDLVNAGLPSQLLFEHTLILPGRLDTREAQRSHCGLILFDTKLSTRSNKQRSGQVKALDAQKPIACWKGRAQRMKPLNQALRARLFHGLCFEVNAEVGHFLDLREKECSRPSASTKISFLNRLAY